jgi:hypothetical protein
MTLKNLPHNSNVTNNANSVAETATSSNTSTSSASRGDRPWIFALMVPLVAVMAGMGVQLIAWMNTGTFRDSLHHVAAIGSIVLVAVRGPVEALARKLLGPRGPLALCVYHLQQVDYFLRSTWNFLSYFSHLWELQPEAALVPVSMFLAAMVLPRMRVPTRRWLRRTAAMSVVLASVLLMAASVRAWRTPGIHRYIASLPVVGSIPAAARRQPPSHERERFEFPGLVVVREVAEANLTCRLTLLPGSVAMPGDVSRHGFTQCDRLTVRVDRRQGAYVVSHQSMWSDSRAYSVTTGQSFTELGMGAGTLRSGFSMPRAWLFDALILLAAALLALVVPSRASALLARHHTWRQGKLGADGNVVFDDGVCVPCPYGTTLTQGPVVMFDDPVSRGAEGPFRGAVVERPDRDALAQGTIPEVLSALEASIDARVAFAMAAALLAAAPWAAVAVLGMLR